MLSPEPKQQDIKISMKWMHNALKEKQKAHSTLCIRPVKILCCTKICEHLPLPALHLLFGLF